MATEVVGAYPVFNKTNGEPLDAGKIYIGEPGQNPTTAEKAAFWDQDMSIPAAQPIRTIGGYLSNNGSPGRLYVEGRYGIAAYDKADQFVYSALNEGEAVRSNVFDNVAALKENDSTAYSTGDIVTVLDINATYTVGDPETTEAHIANAGGVKFLIKPAPLGTYQISITQWGWTPGDTSDWGAEFQESVNLAAEKGYQNIVPGEVHCSDQIWFVRDSVNNPGFPNTVAGRWGLYGPSAMPSGRNVALNLGAVLKSGYTGSGAAFVWQKNDQNSNVFSNRGVTVKNVAFEADCDGHVVKFGNMQTPVIENVRVDQKRLNSSVVHFRDCDQLDVHGLFAFGADADGLASAGEGITYEMIEIDTSRNSIRHVHTAKNKKAGTWYGGRNNADGFAGYKAAAFNTFEHLSSADCQEGYEFTGQWFSTAFNNPQLRGDDYALKLVNADLRGVVFREGGYDGGVIIGDSNNTLDIRGGLSFIDTENGTIDYRLFRIGTTSAKISNLVIDGVKVNFSSSDGAILGVPDGDLGGTQNVLRNAHYTLAPGVPDSPTFFVRNDSGDADSILSIYGAFAEFPIHDSGTGARGVRGGFVTNYNCFAGANQPITPAATMNIGGWGYFNLTGAGDIENIYLTGGVAPPPGASIVIRAGGSDARNFLTTGNIDIASDVPIPNNSSFRLTWIGGSNYWALEELSS